MPRKIPRVRSSKKTETILNGMGLRSFRPEEIAQKFEAATVMGMYAGGRDIRDEENEMVEMIDQGRLYAEMMEEHLQSYKRLKGHRDIDTKLKALAQMCPDILMTALAKGGTLEKLKAVKEILDRVQGKPIERTMNMNMVVENKTEAEIDNELRRLTSKLGLGAKEGVSEVVVAEGSDTGRDKV